MICGGFGENIPGNVKKIVKRYRLIRYKKHPAA